MRDLAALEKTYREFGRGASAAKLPLLRRLARARLRNADEVLRLHEILLFLRAFPDDAKLLRQVDRMLRDFPRRRDLKKHAEDLADTGIAGTPIVYPFFHETAVRLAERWPDRIDVAWDDVEKAEKIEDLLPLLALYAETPALDEWAMPAQEWLHRMKRRDEAAGAFLIHRIAAIPASDDVRRMIFEGLGFPFRLDAGPDTPARTRITAPRSRVVYQKAPPSHARPSKEELTAPPKSVRYPGGNEAVRWIETARDALVTRSRDLDAFAAGDPKDVRILDFGHGRSVMAVGVVPERRLLLEASYGYLMLRNGVPVGYGFLSGLYGSAEVAFNVFETFRGAEAPLHLGTVMSTARHLFDADAFTVYPYQMGNDNDEALASGAWWFYQKLGFRARNREVLALMTRELARMKKEPGHRSSLPVLRRLARENVWLHTGRKRSDVIGVLPLSKIGFAVTDLLARRFGSDRTGAVDVLSREAARRLGTTIPTRAGSRLAFERWAPLVACLGGVERWSLPDRRALDRLVRLKGGRRESDFVRAFDGHVKLRKAIADLARRTRS